MKTIDAKFIAVFHVSDTKNLSLNSSHKGRTGGIGAFYVTETPGAWMDALNRKHIHSFYILETKIVKISPSQQDIYAWALKNNYLEIKKVVRPDGTLVHEMDGKTPLMRPELTKKAEELPFFGNKDPLRGGGLLFLEYAYLRSEGFAAIESQYSPDGHEIAVFDLTALQSDLILSESSDNTCTEDINNNSIESGPSL